jgi:hypothetical protein
MSASPQVPSPRSATQTGDVPLVKTKRRRVNWVVSDVMRKGKKLYLEWSAKLRGQRFVCTALQGESEYNLTVNCDLTVSCNCQDYDGSGHIGDLNKNTFKEVFFGAKAQHLRDELAKGKLPLMTCTRCGDLQKVSKNDPQIVNPKPRLPYRGMLLENTVRCNIDCLGCDRQQAARLRSTKQMDLDKLSLMADLVSELGLEQLFYLNLGEPFLSPNIGQELPLLRQKNPNCRIVISSNAIVLNNDIKREAALSASHIFFSVAGVDDAMLKKYEKYGSFDKAYANMKALVQYRNARGLSQPIIEWKYLLFNWNDRGPVIKRAVEMAREAGVDAISFWPTNNPFYGFSFRYRLGMLNGVGVKNWKGREVDLRAGRETAVAPEPAPA